MDNMIYFAITMIFAYGIFRCYLDIQDTAHLERIDEQLRGIHENVYGIKLRMRNEKYPADRE